ncbi:MAG: TldD/PmbA family protein, partial [Chloroflexota bacterium]|nr:TldD/PmbA family protein [Chloroflexota bacterium]
MKQLQQILDSARQVAGQAEVFRVSAQETPVQFEANRLKQVQTKESSSVSLRIIKEGRLGFSAASGSLFAAGSEKGGKGGVESLVEMAVETSRLANPVRFQFPSPGNYPGVIVFDPQIEKVTMEEMVELGSQLIARVREHTPGILCDARLTRGTSSVRMINSQGGEASYQKSFFAVGLEGVIIQGTDMLFVGDSEASCSLPDNRERVAERVIKQLEMAKGRASVSSKSLPVIFTPPGVASAFAGPLALAFNGKMALEGTSPLKDKLGKKVFDSGLSLWDDALQDYRLGSSPCDDEGVPSQRLPLITKGTASAFFYDLQTAALAG